jgi:putative restriction endonuclease
MPISVQILDYFIYAFTHLRRDSKKGGAPHKPILLLAVINEYESNRILDDKIFISPELIYSFSTLWNKLVTTGHDQKFALPFFHLTGEKGDWWQLIPNPGCELWIENSGSMRSFGNLSVAVSYAKIDQNLALLLLNLETRNLLKNSILKEYFPKSVEQQINIQEDNYIDDLKNEMKESSNEYKSKLLNLKTKLNPEKYQVEIYNRSTIFRREIVKLYNETCCISGLHVSAPFTITMVDACHIIPFSNSLDNSLTNGIALCPNLHRAFDRGLISVDDNYEVILSENFIENVFSDYSFLKVKGKKISLPSDNDLIPSAESFSWHRQNIFKK